MKLNLELVQKMRFRKLILEINLEEVEEVLKAIPHDK